MTADSVEAYDIKFTLNDPPSNERQNFTIGLNDRQTKHTLGLNVATLVMEIKVGAGMALISQTDWVISFAFDVKFAEAVGEPVLSWLTKNEAVSRFVIKTAFKRIASGNDIISVDVDMQWRKTDQQNLKRYAVQALFFSTITYMRLAAHGESLPHSITADFKDFSPDLRWLFEEPDPNLSDFVEIY